MLAVIALLVLAAKFAASQELGKTYNVTIQQGVPATLKYIVDSRNHTLKVRAGDGWGPLICRTPGAVPTKSLVSLRILDQLLFLVHLQLQRMHIMMVTFCVTN